MERKLRLFPGHSLAAQSNRHRFAYGVLRTGRGVASDRSACRYGAHCCSYQPWRVPDLASSRQVPDQWEYPDYGEVAWHLFGGFSGAVTCQWSDRLAHHYLVLARLSQRGEKQDQNNHCDTTRSATPSAQETSCSCWPWQAESWRVRLLPVPPAKDAP